MGAPSTTVVGPVIKRLTGSVNEPPPSPPPGRGGGPPSGGKPGGGQRSAFELAVQALSPVANYRFRDGNFNARIRDYAQSNHLTKQIAAATRSSVPTRTTHPGGAYFPAVTYDNWATQGTFYKGPSGVLQDEASYTLLISVRFIAENSAGSLHKVFAIGTENVGSTGTNDLVIFGEPKSGGGAGVQSKYRHDILGGGIVAINGDVTNTVSDGVNRLFTVRKSSAAGLLMRSSKPGATYVLEDSGGGTNDLADISRALLLNARSNTSTGSTTTTGFVVDAIAVWDEDIGATAEEDLHDKWTAELGAYYPSMMQFDGSTGYYSKTYTSTGSAITVTARFNTGGGITGDVIKDMIRFLGPTNKDRVRAFVASDDYTTAADEAGKVVIVVKNSAGTNICRLISSSTVTDGEDHLLFFSFDGSTGTAVFRIDQINEDDTGNAGRVAPTTGTLESGASSTAVVGARDAAGTNYWPGTIGMIGHRETALTNYSDFGTGDSPAAIDEVNWTEWGAQPLVWSHTGECSNNKGSAGDFTANGTITMTTGGSP